HAGGVLRLRCGRTAGVGPHGRPSDQARVKRSLVVLLLLFGSGCGTNVAFKQDHRVSIVYPRNRQKVTLPMTVRWTVKDFDGTFGVLLDRAPQPPGEPLTWFARNDKSCK